MYTNKFCLFYLVIFVEVFVIIPFLYLCPQNETCLIDSFFLYSKKKMFLMIEFDLYSLTLGYSV